MSLLGDFIHNLMDGMVIGASFLVYIAGTDLIPEVNKHNENLKFSLVQVAIFVIAILITYALAHFAEHAH